MQNEAPKTGNTATAVENATQPAVRSRIWLRRIGRAVGFLALAMVSVGSAGVVLLQRTMDSNTAVADGFSQDAFEKVTEGMTAAEVLDLLGSPGSVSPRQWWELWEYDWGTIAFVYYGRVDRQSLGAVIAYKGDAIDALPGLDAEVGGPLGLMLGPGPFRQLQRDSRDGPRVRSYPPDPELRERLEKGPDPDSVLKEFGPPGSRRTMPESSVQAWVYATARHKPPSRERLVMMDLKSQRVRRVYSKDRLR